MAKIQDALNSIEKIKNINISCKRLEAGWEGRLRSFALRVKAESSTIKLLPNVRWWGQLDSNQWPPLYQSGDLTS